MVAVRTMLAGVLLLSGSVAIAGMDFGNLKSVAGIPHGSVMQNVNKSLAEQQIKDGQFEFRVGKAEFAPGNEKRIKGLLKVLTEHSNALKVAFPHYHVTAIGHTDADGTPAANRKLSLARANTVCRALKTKGLTVPCRAIGVGSSQPLVRVEKTAVDKQRNRRVLVQVAK